MYVKFSPENLNLESYPPHPTNTYTCKVTIVPRMCGDMFNFVFISIILSISISNLIVQCHLYLTIL